MTEPSPRMNLRQQAKAATAAKVFEAAHALFQEVGYEAATIRDIARRAGMSTGAVFANFDDKVALYQAIYGRRPLSPEQGAVLRAALRRAEAFIAGFEGDPSQGGVEDLLVEIRAALSEASQ